MVGDGHNFSLARPRKEVVNLPFTDKFPKGDMSVQPTFMIDSLSIRPNLNAPPVGVRRQIFSFSLLQRESKE